MVRRSFDSVQDDRLVQLLAAVRAVFWDVAHVIQPTSAVGTFHEGKTPEEPRCDDQNSDPDKRMHIFKFTAPGTKEKNNYTDNFEEGIDFCMGFQFKHLQFLFQGKYPQECVIQNDGAVKLVEQWSIRMSLRGAKRRGNLLVQSTSLHSRVRDATGRLPRRPGGLLAMTCLGYFMFS